MFFLFSKLLIIFIYPLSWIFALLLLAFFSRNIKRKRWYLGISIVLLFLFSNEFLQNEFLRKWEIAPSTLPPGQKYDYAIVLGTFSRYDTVYHRFELTEAGDRLWQALQLYRQKKVSKLFISGGSGKLLDQKDTEADRVKTALRNLNIPDTDILIDPTSRNTHENAVHSARWIRQNAPSARCLLITSAFHMRRALGCFKKEGVNVTPYSANWKTQPRSFAFDNLFVPYSEVMSEWDLLIKEMVGYAAYKLMGYL